MKLWKKLNWICKSKFLLNWFQLFTFLIRSRTDIGCPNLTSRTGVSNTRPAWRVKAARVIVKIILWPAETFLPHCAARYIFFIKIWPASIYEFETTVLEPVLKRSLNIKNLIKCHLGDRPCQTEFTNLFVVLKSLQIIFYIEDFEVLY